MTVNTNELATAATGISALALATGNKGLGTAAGLIGAGFAVANRLQKAGLFGGSESAPFGHIAEQATFADGSTDWRVKLSLPESFKGSLAMAPLTDMDAFVFPFTPQVNVTHTANYNPLATTHNNYNFLAYENSKVEQISITGEFYCETSVDAAYWVACVHYLKSATKMSFGSSADAGQPPPIVKLSGYGRYVFNDIPVVIKSFTLDLPKDVDYIACQPGITSGGLKTAGGDTYAPVKSTINVIVSPIYSRQQQRAFSLEKYINGDYLTEGETGYI
jgi:hypothetical protein